MSFFMGLCTAVAVAVATAPGVEGWARSWMFACAAFNALGCIRELMIEIKGTKNAHHG